MLPSMEFDQRRWNRLLLRGYGIIVLLATGVETLYLLFATELPKGDFIVHYIVRPTLLMTVVVLLAAAGVRWLDRFHDYILITASALLTFIVSAIHSSVDYLLFFLLFPIMISIFYFQYKKLLFAVVLTFAAWGILYGWNAEIHERISVVAFVGMCVMLAVYSTIAFGVLTRGRAALQHLRTSYESNQELLVRNILMDKLAKTDALTDTYNHMAYHEFVDNLVEQADSGRLAIHIAVIDIDNFKSVNDTYGHRAGDAVLRAVAGIARSLVGPNDFVARYGGEEFVILFTEGEYASVYDTVEDIRRAVADTRHEALRGSAVTISIGLGGYSPGMGKERFFHRADAALYDAKHSGKNRTVFAESAEPPAPKEAAGA